MAPLARLLVIALLLAPVAPAQVLHVPGDYPDPQSAIAAASPGAVVVVEGGFWLPITIDKPLTLVGVADAIGLPLFLPDGPPPVAQSPITLAGGGSGTVRLAHIQVGGNVDGSAYSACAPSISGGGFAELHVFDSFIEGAPWVFAYNTTFPGADGINVDVPFVWVERCTVRGAFAVADDNHAHTSCPDAGDALVTTGTVMLLDSDVNGGTGPVLEWDSDGAGSCPPSCPGGAGGDGVRCAKLVHSGSSIGAGTGAIWLADVGSFPCCVGPVGADVDAPEQKLPDDLVGTGPAHLGQPWNLGWSLPGPAVLLFVSASVGPAPQLGNPALHLPPPHFLGVVLPSTFQIDTVVPAAVAFTGVEYGVQLYSLVTGWSRPLAGVIAP